MVNQSQAARLLGDDGQEGFRQAPAGAALRQDNALTILVVVPTLQSGAADAGTIELVQILAQAGHCPIVASRGGRMVSDVTSAGGKFVYIDAASLNPLVILRNAVVLSRLIRQHGCHAVHAHGRGPGWSAYLAARWRRVPFLTSCYKGFREQNAFKHIYNGVMARGDRVIAASEQIADLVHERYGTSWERLVVIPAGIDSERFDPAKVSRERIAAVRQSWGVKPETKVVLVVGRMLRRKGHHVAVKAAQRLKDMGLKDFALVFIGEDQGRTRYTGELWDLVLATDTASVIRMAGPAIDVPAAYAASYVVVSAAIQPEGLQRSLLEAQAMARPVIVSDLGAGPDVVLAPPAVPEDRITGLRYPAGDDAALAAALIRLFSMPEQMQRTIGLRGRDWVLAHFNVPAVAEPTLRAYAELIAGRLPS